jgi:hypothetical protein
MPASLTPFLRKAMEYNEVLSREIADLETQVSSYDAQEDSHK